MTKLEEFSYLWENPDEGRYVLNKLDTTDGYVILDWDGFAMVIIEDDDLYKAVIQKMLEAGVQQKYAADFVIDIELIKKHLTDAE